MGVTPEISRYSSGALNDRLEQLCHSRWRHAHAPELAAGSVGNIMYRELPFLLLTRKDRSGDARA